MAPLSTVHQTPSPGGLLEIVFSFDTTGSMCGFLDQVRGRLQDMIQRLQADIPGIRVAVFAHGDYCDQATSYVTKWEDFSNDVTRLCKFVSTVSATGGGDSPECYELVLRQARTELTWTPGSRRALVLIGDDVPHEASEACNKDNIDWREELRHLAVMGVTVYGVQCASRAYATPFYKTISDATQGKHLQLEDMSAIFDVLMAVCYREGNDHNKFTLYEKEARSRAHTVIGPDVDAIFKSLRDDGKDRGMLAKSPSILPAKIPAKPKTLPYKPALKLNKKNKRLEVASKSSRVKQRKTRVLELTKGLEKFKVKNLPKLKREIVPESNFQFRYMKWSSWVCAFSPSIPASCTASNPLARQSTWTSRNGRPGFRLSSLSATHKKPSALRFFELAVAAPGRRRRVTFSRVTSRCVATPKWERFLLTPFARAQLDKCLSQGHRVLIRECVLSRKSQLRETRKGIKRYDYAWCKAGGGPRELSV